MKNKFTIVKNIFLNYRTLQFLYDISIFLLLMLIVLFWLAPSDRLWKNIIINGYLMSTLCIIIFQKVTSISNKIGFRETSIWSFLSWCVFFPIPIGSMFECLIYHFIGADIRQNIIVSITITTIAFTVAWFTCQIRLEENNTAQLDLYSSIIVAPLSLLSLSLDYSSIKIPFLIIFFIYSSIQILIKAKICNQQRN